LVSFSSVSISKAARDCGHFGFLIGGGLYLLLPRRVDQQTGWQVACLVECRESDRS
jgi:hypothetical protein